jgi:diaminohydroxyphosphoribosylaminopyrimidine deaminase / 5-amino-6-(5-phosphoribosylamino)uracil reductase
VKVTLKLATSLDGRIATASGESRWITGEAAREQVHRLRALHRAVLVGVETVIADDPELTVRFPGFMGQQPIRVVLDSSLRIPLDCKLVTEARRLETVVISLRDSNDRLTDAGVTVLKVAQDDGRPDLKEAMTALHRHIVARGVRAATAYLNENRTVFEARVDALMAKAAVSLPGERVLVEGGGQVAASFLKAGLVDAIEWFRAPILLGDEGRPAVGEFVLQKLADAPRFKRVSVEALGDDLWERYERA